MDVILSASIIAAFLAGMVALFAPCCITILLPAYMATAFRERKNILKMTFVFFAGIAVILIPIGLGAASLAKVFQDFHIELYLFGGLFMLVLATMSLLGKGMAIIPMGKMSSVTPSDFKSVFLLGIFSGASTSCCAPVLVGAITLAVVSGVFWKALLVTFAYVFGMTFPLFLAGYFYDRYRIEDSQLIRGKIWQMNIGGKTRYVHSTNVLAAIVFAVMGAILLLLGMSGNTYWSPDYQVTAGQLLKISSEWLTAKLMAVPDFFWGIIIIALFAYLYYQSNNRKNG